MKRQLTPLSNLVDNGIQGIQKDSLKKAVVVEPNFKEGGQKKKKKTAIAFSSSQLLWPFEIFCFTLQKKQTI